MITYIMTYNSSRGIKLQAVMKHWMRQKSGSGLLVLGMGNGILHHLTVHGQYKRQSPHILLFLSLKILIWIALIS